MYVTCFIRSTATWSLNVPYEEKQGWRHVRIHQTGKNASGQTHYLSMSGFEIYGTVTGVCDDLGNEVYIICNVINFCYIVAVHCYKIN